MSAVLDRIRTRIVPACLTALGVALLAGGLLSYTTPVAADPCRGHGHAEADGDPARRGVDAEPADHAATDRLRAARRRRGSRDPGRPGPTRVRIAALKIDLPVIRPEQLPRLQRGDVVRRSTARAAGRGQGDLPLRPRPDRDVPPAAQPVQDPEREEDDRDGRGAVDQRRPALPVRHHRRAPARADDECLQRPVRRQDRAALAPDVRRRRADAQAPDRRRAPVAGAGRRTPRRNPVAKPVNCR